MVTPENNFQIYRPINDTWQAVFSLEGDIAGEISKNRFVGSPYQPSSAPKRAKQNSNICFFWNSLLHTVECWSEFSHLADPTVGWWSGRADGMQLINIWAKCLLELISAKWLARCRTILDYLRITQPRHWELSRYLCCCWVSLGVLKVLVFRGACHKLETKWKFGNKLKSYWCNSICSTDLYVAFKIMMSWQFRADVL